MNGEKLTLGDDGISLRSSERRYHIFLNIAVGQIKTLDE